MTKDDKLILLNITAFIVGIFFLTSILNIFLYNNFLDGGITIFIFLLFSLIWINDYNKYLNISWNFKRWMEYRGIIILIFSIYPLSYLTILIICAIFKKEILTIRKFNDFNVSLWKEY